MVSRRNPRGLTGPVWLCGLLVALAPSPRGLSAQSASSFDEVGRFYMWSFAPEEYGYHPQNWAVVQDEKGIVYVGNGYGVLEYDGVSWRKIGVPNGSVPKGSVPKGSIARSLAIDSEGRIFVGASAEIGYLAPGPQGRMKYVSLVEHIPEEDRAFADVWRTYALSDGIYFQSSERVFRWRNGQIEVWRPEVSFLIGFAVHDTFYVSDQSGVLLIMDRDTLRLAPDGAKFGGVTVTDLVPHEADSFLVVTRAHGLMRCRGGAPKKEACTAYGPGLTELLKRLAPYSAALMPGGILAIGTQGGVVLIDSNAQLLRIVNEASGLPSDQVWSTYVDRQGGLWLGLQEGLARIEMWISPASRLVRLDTEAVLDSAVDYPVWIRHIVTSDGSSLYHGPHGRPDTAPAWPYSKSALRFVFAAPRYDRSEQTRYRTRLDGFDDDWSAWSDETDKDYTNLSEGRYTFRVQARDAHGIVSREDTFAFRILPPWYRTWWAYGLYGLALAAVVLAWVRYHREELRRERQAAEHERVVNQRLREVDRLKDEFLANTSHELRTPLHGITGLAEALVHGSRGELSEPMKNDLSLIAASGRRLASLVDDILDFSKLRDDKLELALEPVDLHAVTHAVLTLARPLIGKMPLELVNSVPTELVATADEARLQQVLYNLVGNAVKFTEGGRVEVSARPTGLWIELSVTDTGIGVSPEDQQRIFESFEQADGSLSRKHDGAGLGLAISRQLIELHGGWLKVESKLGAGSRFVLTLPMSQEVPVPKTGELISASLRPIVEDSGAMADRMTDPALVSPDGDFTFLVVDDEPLIRRVLVDHLCAAGYRVLEASSGAEALRQLESASVDLVLLDVMMPKMSGYEVCRKVRLNQAREELPIIFLSAKDQVEDLVSGFSKGANDYLIKPIGRRELLARVSTHLSLLSIHRQQVIAQER